MPRWKSFLIDLSTERPLDLSPDDVKRVNKRFEFMLKRRRRVQALILAGVAAMIGIGFATGTGVSRLVESLGGSSLHVGLASGVLTPLVLLIVWLFMFPRILRHGVRLSLRDCGFDVCVVCGYDLTGKGPNARCPECGSDDQPPLGGEAPHEPGTEAP